MLESSSVDLHFFYSVFLCKGLDTVINTFELLKQERPGGSRYPAYEGPSSPV